MCQNGSLSIPFWSDFIGTWTLEEKYGVEAFNPILVWFYHVLTIFANHVYFIFQSHFGLILSLKSTSTVNGISSLSIPFWSDFIELRIWKTSTPKMAFNPILVWFYRASSSLSPYFSASFQSHFGLILSYVVDINKDLKRLLSIPFWSDFIEKVEFSLFPSKKVFQSHFGLILSLVDIYLLIVLFPPFNPILVWFYHISWIWEERRDKGFQSHFGLILSRSDGYEPESNSRLSIPFWSDFIQKYIKVKSTRMRIFQSHFGLILSPIILMGEELDSYLSIPFWSDFIHYDVRIRIIHDWTFNPILVWFYQRSCRKVVNSRKVLSIPFWSDFIPIIEDYNPNAITLSIPFWSDFIETYLMRNKIRTKTFNPILVWFYPAGADTYVFCVSNFQSHFGLILSFLIQRRLKRCIVAFNPILVWFYQPASRLINRPYRLFQSHFGLILSSTDAMNARMPYITFNPILVWFYPKYTITVCCSALSFQSHFGLILSGCR